MTLKEKLLYLAKFASALGVGVEGEGNEQIY